MPIVLRMLSITPCCSAVILYMNLLTILYYSYSTSGAGAGAATGTGVGATGCMGVAEGMKGAGATGARWTGAIGVGAIGVGAIGVGAIGCINWIGAAG